MKYDKMEDIPLVVVERMKKQKTYLDMAERYAGARHMEVGDLTDDEWRGLYWAKSTARASYYRKTKVEELAAETPPPSRSESKPISLDDYLEYYTDPAPNDLVTIQQLVSMQNQLSQIERQIAEVLDDDDINVNRWHNLVKMQKELSGETRQLQESLNISKRARDAMRQDRKVSDYLVQNIAQARELIADYGTKLFCPHCAAEEKQINQGFIIHHFPEMGFTWSTRCPTCSREYTITRKPVKWERRVEVKH